MKHILMLSVLFGFNLYAKDIVIIETSLGEIEVELDREKAPKTVANFLSYVDKKFYDGTIFHRVIKNFMIQGGGFDEKMNQKKTEKPVENEAANGLKNVNGSIAMARTNDPHSATAQFFINVEDNKFLDHSAPTTQGYGYAVFGKVIGGMPVVNRIKAVKTGRVSGHSDVPMDPVIIKSIKRKK